MLGFTQFKKLNSFEVNCMHQFWNLASLKTGELVVTVMPFTLYL